MDNSLNKDNITYATRTFKKLIKKTKKHVTQDCLISQESPNLTEKIGLEK